MNFQAFVDDIRRNQWNVFGAEVYADGRLIHRYGDTEGRYPVYSVVKTITSIAAGMAVDEGKLVIGRCVLDYLPADVTGQMPKEQQEAYRLITIKRLLTMSVEGYPFRPTGESWIRDALQYPIANPGESGFAYSNLSAHLVGVAVSCAVGEDLYQYLNRRLFQPLGIIEPPFTRCPDGYFYGASGMELSVNELSRIGLLLHNGGVWEGKRLLSEAYVKEASSVQQMNREDGYGYFLWKYRDGFSINGKWGQKCYVLPSEKRMVTFLSHIDQGSGELKKSMEKHILDDAAL